MRIGSVIAAAMMSGAVALGGSVACAATEDTEALSGFLATVPGMGSLLDLTYGSRALDAAPADSADLAETNRMYLRGLEGVGATILRTDDFRVGLRTRGALREDDDRRDLVSSDVLDVGVFGELTLDDWKLSASVGQGLGERSGGFAGDLGLKWATRFADGWKLEVGPELSWASDDYMSGLADFTPRRIPGRGLQLYDPTPGARDVTLSGSVEYSISNNWTVGGMIGAQRMMGETALNPAAEDENEYFGGISLGVRF